MRIQRIDLYVVKLDHHYRLSGSDETARGIGLNEFVVLGRYYYSMNSQWFVLVVIFYGNLSFRVRPEVGQL